MKSSLQLKADCAHCGLAFIYLSRGGRHRRYCSADCRRNHLYPRVARTLIACENCAEPFVSRGQFQRFCSERCRRNAAMRRYGRRIRSLLRESHVRGVIAENLGIRSSQVPDELVRAKRLQLLVRRLCKGDARQSESMEILKSLNCERCGALFIQRTSQQKFCSEDCSLLTQKMRYMRFYSEHRRANP